MSSSTPDIDMASDDAHDASATTNGVDSVASNTSTEPSKNAPKALLSCELCRTRKVKCDKAWPSCSTCARAGVKCIMVNRQRLPRGRNGGRRKVVDADLKARVGRLENLVKTLGADPNGIDSTALGLREALELRHTSSRKENDSRRASTDGHETESVVNNNISQYLGSHFWAALSSEVTGLREVLDHSSDDEDESQQDHSSMSSDHSPRDFLSRDFSYIICGPESFVIGPEALRHPPPETVKVLCNIYFENIDPLIKVLHRPSVEGFLLHGKQYMHYAPGCASVEALCFAIYYAALVSQTDIEANMKFGESKQTLLKRFRFAAQVSLARADLINTNDPTTLQALLILLILVRLQDSSRFSWTLVAIALRIGQALRLNVEIGRQNETPFEREMRRRLWHQLSLLDHHAAFDRGTQPIGNEAGGNPPVPLNINDEDMSPDSDEPIQPRDGFTETAFSLMCYDASLLRRRLLMYYPLDPDPSTEDGSEFKARQQAVDEFREHIEKQFIRHCDTTQPFQWYMKTVGELMVAGSTLFSVRPMKRVRQSLPPGLDRAGVLKLAVRVLELAERIDRAPEVRRWRWNLWIQWHALAVTYAELCTQTEGGLVEQAWKVAESSAESMARDIADSNRGKLWKPMERLRKTALRTRSSYSPASLFTKSPPNSDLTSDQTRSVNSPQVGGKPAQISQGEQTGIAQTVNNATHNKVTPSVRPVVDPVRHNIWGSASMDTQPAIQPMQSDANSLEWWPTLFTGGQPPNEIGGPNRPFCPNIWNGPGSNDALLAGWEDFVEDYQGIGGMPDPVLF